MLVYSNKTIVVGGYVRGYIIRPCDRCLKPVKVFLDGVIEAVYDMEGKVDEKEELQDLRNVIYYQGEVIDLEERIQEALVIAAPNVVLCKPDCKGLCPYCGVDLNEHPNHVCTLLSEEDAVDPRLEKLLELKKGEEG